MSFGFPNILILGHSFVRRLRDDLKANFDSRASQNFHIPESGYVTMLGTGGRTVEKVIQFDLSSVRSAKPDIIILELGTNDLTTHAPEVVGSRLEELARQLRDEFHVRVIGVCQVIDRNIAKTRESDSVFNTKAALLRQYLSVVLAEEQGIFLWEHREFFNPARVLLSTDGVHCNTQGQYCLYRSYRGAILKALALL